MLQRGTGGRADAAEGVGGIDLCFRVVQERRDRAGGVGGGRAECGNRLQGCGAEAKVGVGEQLGQPAAEEDARERRS